MKNFLTLIVLIPYALNAMDINMQKSKPIEKIIFPIFEHARIDKGQETVRGFLGAECRHKRSPRRALQMSRTTNSSLTSLPLRSNDVQVKILETIPNDTTELFIVLYSFKKSQAVLPYLGAVIAKYGEKISLGEETNGVQYYLQIPRLHKHDTIRPLVDAANLSDDARMLLALTQLQLT